MVVWVLLLWFDEREIDIISVTEVMTAIISPTISATAFSILVIMVISFRGNRT